MVGPRREADGDRRLLFSEESPAASPILPAPPTGTPAEPDDAPDGWEEPTSDLRRDPSLFREFRATRDPRLRAQLILDHHGLAQSIARRFTWPGLTADDLIQIAR